MIATPDNRFYLSWIEKKVLSGRSIGDLSHAVYNAANGDQVLAPQLISDNDFLDYLDWWEATVGNYEPTADEYRVLMAYVFRDTSDPGNPQSAIKYRVMNTNGVQVLPANPDDDTSLYPVNGEGLDIEQLSDGRLALAWTNPGDGRINYTILEQNLSAPGAPTALDNPDNRRGGAVSVTSDADGRAILSWMDRFWFGRLYYALVDYDDLITPPMTIKYAQSNLETALQTRVALGNAPYEPWFMISLPLVRR
jgi:hypothetical protein